MSAANTVRPAEQDGVIPQGQRMPTGLVLQGGGALGAFEYGVVRRLDEASIRPNIIAGVSIGAFNAACMVGGKYGPIGTLELLWERLAVDDHMRPFLWAIGNPHFYRPRTDYWNMFSWTCWSDARPIRQVLNDLIDFEALNASPTSLILSAVNVESGRLEYFTNFGRGQITLDHILASGSLPPGLPMTTIGRNTYWDGGLFDNTPLKPVMKQLHTMRGAGKRVFLVRLFSQVGRVPRNMADVYDRMQELRFAHRIEQDQKVAQRTNIHIRLLRALTRYVGPEDRKALEEVIGDYEYIDVEAIGYDNNGGAGEPADFTKSRIRERIMAGREAAARYLADQLPSEPTEANARAQELADRLEQQAAAAPAAVRVRGSATPLRRTRSLTATRTNDGHRDDRTRS